MKIVWDYLAYLSILFVIVLVFAGLIIAADHRASLDRKRELDIAHHEGTLAFQAGLSCSSIPYRDSKLRVKWLEGWIEASKEKSK